MAPPTGRNPYEYNRMAHELSRFRFIAQAMRGDGLFRPVVADDTPPVATALVRYPRESDIRFARRNELAWYASPLSRAVSRFVGHLSSRAPLRELQNELYTAIADDADAQGNALDVFWSDFAREAAARGSMLLLVDMPATLPANLADQVRRRVVPYLAAIEPERVTEYQIGDDGRFDFVEFSGTFYPDQDSDPVAVVWHYDRAGWWARETKRDEVVARGDHPLGECPVIAFTETGAFPCFGRFSPIADIAKRLFNLQSELDEILRSQTFSLLTMQVPEESTDEQKMAAAAVVGQTIGTSNLMVHSGSTPAFIAPPDGPASTYRQVIADLRAQIADIGLEVSGSEARESGIALQMRFHELNAALASFAARMEDLERRVWELARRWMRLQAVPRVVWPRDFAIADVTTEIEILDAMRASGLPDEVIREQERKVVQVQFAGADPQRMDAMVEAIEERAREVKTPGAGTATGNKPQDDLE